MTYVNAYVILLLFGGFIFCFIKLAKAFPESIEGVSERIEFLKASAAKLPFKNDEFDAIVSCLTFHEVKDEQDKMEVIKEALRVLKPGGEFVFLDLFLDEKIFGKELLNSLELSELKSYKLDEGINLPKLLLNKKVLGKAMVLSGRK